jgi:putative SbcD/Mre11-related phosphoesterase
MKNYNFVSKTVYFPNEKILVIGDLHFGYEDELNEKGIAIPGRQVEEIIQDLNRILKKIDKVNKIVVLGDIRHSFGVITKNERQDINNFLDFLDKKLPRSKVILIKGNHDTMINIIFKEKKWKNVKIVDYFIKREILFFHGDKKSFEKTEKVRKKAKIIIIGHFHPAINLTDGEKVEKFKCFLVGNLGKKTIIVVPSFFPLIEGSNIFNRNNKIHLLKIKRSYISVISPDEVVFDFGKIN